MSRIIVITSGKGGVGKTTCTANLGMALAQLNRKVVVVDADFGLRNLDLLLGLENRVVYTAVDVLAGECRLDQALVKDKRQPNLMLLPAAQNRMKDAILPEQMRQILQELSSKYDYILVDCPAGIEQGFHNAIAGSTEAIVVTTPEISAVRDADRVVGLLEAHDIQNTYLLLNRLKPSMVEANDMMSVEDVQEILAISLIGVIPEDDRVIVSTNRGEPLVLNDDSGSLAGVAIGHVARRLEGDEVEFIDFHAPPENIFSRLRKLLATKII